MSIYLTLGVDNINQNVVIIGIDENKESAKKSLIDRLNTEKECENVVNTAIFDFGHEKIAFQLHDFLIKAGLTNSDAIQVIRNIAKLISDCFKE